MKQKILLINVDSTKIPNLALKRIEKYHLNKGDEVFWDSAFMKDIADKIYVSCIFTKNKEQVVKDWEGNPKAIIGGSGYDYTVKLPKEIEETELKISYGFTTRGCIRKCGFCFVPKMEGNIRIVGDLYDVWDGKSKECIFLDNNILAVPEHFFKICAQARKEKVTIEFNQGLDIRLLTPKICEEIKKTHFKDIVFAFDDAKYELCVDRGMKLCKEAGINTMVFLCIVGFNTTFEQDIYRFYKLKEFGEKYKINVRPFCMRFEKVHDYPEYVHLAQWVNSRASFAKMDYPTFLQKYFPYYYQKTIQKPLF